MSSRSRYGYSVRISSWDMPPHEQVERVGDGDAQAADGWTAAAKPRDDSYAGLSHGGVSGTSVVLGPHRTTSPGTRR